MHHEPSQVLTDKAILTAVLWQSSQGFPYTFQHLLNDWSQEFGTVHLPNADFPERALPFMRRKFCQAVRDCRPGLEDASSKADLVTPERANRGDLHLTRSPSGYIVSATLKDMTIMAALIDGRILQPDHGYSGQKYRDLCEAYQALFYLASGRAGEGAGTEDRMKADDYLEIRRNLTQRHRIDVDYICFTPADTETVADLERHQQRYKDAFDALGDVLQMQDDRRREPKDKQQNACADAPEVA